MTSRRGSLGTAAAAAAAGGEEARARISATEIKKLERFLIVLFPVFSRYSVLSGVPTREDWVKFLLNSNFRRILFRKRHARGEKADVVAVVMMRSNEKRQKTIPRGSPSHFQSAVVCLRPLFFFFECHYSVTLRGFVTFSQFFIKNLFWFIAQTDFVAILFQIYVCFQILVRE